MTPESPAAAREAIERVREALEYQERESLVGLLFPEAQEALLVLEAELRSLEARYEQTERECDAMRELVSSRSDSYFLSHHQKDRAERAEAEVERLREALAKIGRSGERERNPDGSLVTAQQIARATLASTSTPAAEGEEE